VLVSIWNYRRFIWQNAVRDLRHRYAGSSMGFLWNVINPLSQILIYTVVFSRLMEIRIPNLSSASTFAVYLCSGLIPWISFNETVIRCTNSFYENANYLKKLALPEIVFVVQNAWSSFLSLLISMMLFIGVCLILGHYPSGSWTILLVILILMQGFAFGLGLIFGILNTFFKDVGQLLVILMQILFWTTPIVYLEGILPLWFKKILPMNPLYHFVRALHVVIVDKKWPSFEPWMVMIGLAIISPILGYQWLTRVKSEIRDVL